MKRKTRILKKRNQKGFTVVEVLVASAMLSVAIGGSALIQNTMIQNVSRGNDRAFATEKATQMFDELRAHTEGSQEDFDESLSNFSDGASYNFNLSSDLSVANPDDPLSENYKTSDHWKYVRQIQVEPLETDDYARRVNVTVWYAGDDGKPRDINKPLASISGILKTNIPKTPPTQVYDFYVISIANTPSWWSDLYDFKPAYDSVFSDLEFRNPGLKLRKRYISNLGYGRDPFYLPHTNTELTTEDSSVRLPWTYYYPGKVRVTNGANNNKIKEDFAFDQFTARIRGDLPDKTFHISEKNNENQRRYWALSDEHNHVLRWPMQKAMEARMRFQATTISRSAILANPDLAKIKNAMEQPTLTSFLQGMNDGNYKNSMLSNMHAELTPIAPTRNYSDAARIPFDEHVADPATSTPGDYSEAGKEYINQRVVTHPERLFYDNSTSTISDPLTWRVYAYETNHFGRTLDQDSDGTTYTDDELIAKTIPHISVFVPTDGKGRKPSNPVTDNSGYLENPDFNASAEISGSESDHFRLRKVIGNQRTSYKYRYDPNAILNNEITTGNDEPETIAASAINNYRHEYRVLTDKDIRFEDLGASYNEQVQEVGQLDVAPTGPVLLFTGLSNSTTNNDDYSAVDAPNDGYLNLIGETIILNASQSSSSATAPANRETAKVVNALRVNGQSLSSLRSTLNLTATELPSLPANGTVILRLEESLNNAHSAGEWVTRHRDFEIEYNPSVYGYTRDGIVFNLFNTPTRQTYNSSNKTGLPANRRLYDLEYVPAPVNHGKASTPNDITDDFMTDLQDTRGRSAIYPSSPQNSSSDDSDPGERAVNTARWTIGMAVDAPGFTGFDDQTITAETRIMGGQSNDNLKGSMDYLEDGMGPDGSTYQPNDPGTAGNEHNTDLRPNLYNASYTYAYTGTSFDSAVPKTEQMQYIGDPRHMPYADVKQRDGYNTAFYCRKNSGSNHSCKTSNSGFSASVLQGNSSKSGGYDGYERHQGFFESTNDIDVDVAKAFSLYTDGLLTSNSVYNTIAGYTNYIISLGGGIGQRGNHTYRYNIKKAPWVTSASTGNTTTTNSENDTTVSERGGKGYLRFVSSNTSSNRWSGYTYLGEMFPDEFYGYWKENGNLPNATYSSSLDDLGSATMPASINGGHSARFYRAKYPDTKYNLAKRERITHEGAISVFYNGSSNPSNDGHRIKHSTSGGDGCLEAGATEAGRFLSDAFNMSLPDAIDSTRSFCISSGNCTSPNGTNANAYNYPENKSRRNTIKYVNLTGPNKGDLVNNPSEYNSFYRFHQGNCSNAVSKNVSSGLIRISRDAVPSMVVADPDKVGYAVINGLEQGSLFGAQSLSRLAQAATLQGYLEGGDKTAPGNDAGRIVPLPRLEITSPNPNQIQSGNSMTIDFDIEWLRWDRRAYTPSYPTSWYDSTPLQVNAIYSKNNGKTWYYVNTNDPVDSEKLGTYDSSQPIVSPNTFAMTSDKVSKNFSWDISSFSNGSYLLRVEAYRDGFDIGYSYHQIYFTLKN